MQTHTKSSPWALLIPLIVAFFVVGVVLLNASNKNSSTDIRSHASSAKALVQCTDSCNKPALAPFIKNAGSCALECTNVVKGTTNCKSFCTTIAKDKVSKDAKLISQCETRCKPWASAKTPAQKCTDICNAYNGVSSKTPQAATYRAQCQVNCAEVANETKTCEQAFPITGSTLDKQVNTYWLTQCNKQFLITAKAP